MKPLLLAAAVCLLAPAAAHAQVAAGSLPNTFDDRNARPAAAPAPAPQTAPAAELSAEPANAASEETLRALVAELQAGELDYGRLPTKATETRAPKPWTIGVTTASCSRTLAARSSVSRP